LRAYIGIHSTSLGPALGGTRLKEYDSESAALRDVLNLSKAMSYKCALANLPYGGGKAVILASPEMDKQEALKAYARLVDKLKGLFKTGTDVGITDDDVALMGNHTSHMLGLTEADRGDMTTGKTAGLGVFYAMKAALTKLYGNTDFTGRKVAIKGVGKLGSELARLVHEAGGELYVSDVSDAALQDLKVRIPEVNIVDNAAVHTQEVDIYAPCALGSEFNEQTIAELRCKAVVGGANNQLASNEAGDKLSAAGILYAPDYIANAGGLIYVADELEPGGFNKERVVERTKAIEQTMLDIFETAQRENQPTHRAADAIALARIREGLHG
jgi:glutamate dehydrogenase/leucine dehydrogenase